MSKTFVKPKTSILSAGDKDVLSLPTNATSFIDISLDDVVQIESGGFSVVAVTKQGQVYGRGLNKHGELALGDTKTRDKWTIITSIPFKVKQVACKSAHSLFLTCEGKVYSCGANEYGQLVCMICL